MKIQFTEALLWQKAKRCTGGNCVEAAEAEGQVLLRNSTNPNMILTFTAEEWDAFVDGVKKGEFSF
ncbi:DUF397 domain-containing protein [Actinoplanes sp. Pm04-4]|uniref:DUF397 domain-containing protein n=1 Tax=Paractinoplanes pyxinae TaxID=2997416 RepID=A0ABT4ATD3_9ACTN|nr:DUF397 domain-containing protein [Actinoplanes pyxinae]MCY1137432.1 DUF397 domain-containing protein [Actinoplanes pyxinae]